MRTGRPKTYSVKLGDEEREQLESFARSRSVPHGLARRAKIILMAAEGIANTAIAEQLEVSNPTIA
jgi:putative transposase